MSRQRRKFTAQQKAEIVRRHLKDKTPISSLAEELNIQPTQIYQWVAMALEQIDKVFAKTDSTQRSSLKTSDFKDQKIKRLEEKLADKNEVIAELMEENVKAKKANGGL
ncbi:MAG: transposase [Pirellulaceae bacterium]